MYIWISWNRGLSETSETLAKKTFVPYGSVDLFQNVKPYGKINIHAADIKEASYM
jgi:hypothetical protein